MKELRVLLSALFITMLIMSCSSDEADISTPNSISKNLNSTRSFPVKDLRFPPSQEDLDYVNSIKDRVLEDNPLLTHLTNNTLYFGEPMWEAPKIIRNVDHGIVYTFVPIFEPTNYQVAHFFGIRDLDGVLTYLIESKDHISSQMENNMLTYTIVNGANIFQYFDYNFGFTDGLTYHNPFVDGEEIDNDTQEYNIDCFTTTYTNEIICTCGGDHSPDEIGLCECNSPGYSCGCPSTSSSSFIDCWGDPIGLDGGTGPSVDGGDNGTGTTFHVNPFIAGLAKYVDFFSKYLLQQLADTPCKAALEQYYASVAGLDYGHPLAASVNCAIKELEVMADGSCNTALPPALQNFNYFDLDEELIEWVHAYDSGVLQNPICGMIVAGYTAAEITTYLTYLKISLENEADPGYDDDDVPDPYSAYNINNTWQNSNKVTKFLEDYPCVKPMDNLGLLLSKPEIVDWANGFMDGDCENESKTNYTHVVFKALKLDSEFVPERFSELYVLLSSNSDILISDCTEDISPWIDLASFVIPNEAKNRLLSLGWKNQDIDQGNSWKVNLDYHSVKIDQLPDINGDGTATPQEFLDEIRLNFPSYADAQFEVIINNGPNFDVAATWSFFQNDFNDFWNTNSPETTIVEIDTESNPDGAGSWLPSGLTDDATVICSSYDNGCCWVFSTIWVTDPGIYSNGSHPVSGNRQFGLKEQGDGKYEFYIKAADRSRINIILALLAPKTGNNATDIFFAITDASWNSLTSNIVALVNSKGGIASQNEPVIIRPRWNDVKSKLKSSFPLTSIPCE